MDTTLLALAQRPQVHPPRRRRWEGQEGAFRIGQAPQPIATCPPGRPHSHQPLPADDAVQKRICCLVSGHWRLQRGLEQPPSVLGRREETPDVAFTLRAVLCSAPSPVCRSSNRGLTLRMLREGAVPGRGGLLEGLGEEVAEGPRVLAAPHLGDAPADDGGEEDGLRLRVPVRLQSPSRYPRASRGEE